MGKAPIDLLIFDLDGTLIESKWDIAASVNFTLEELGLPQRPLEEIFGFVGDGVKKLLRLAVGETNRVSFEEALGVFRRHYLAHCLDRTGTGGGIVSRAFACLVSPQQSRRDSTSEADQCDNAK